MFVGGNGFLAALLLVVVCHQGVGAASVKSLNGRKVVLMSMDGFRHDYLTKAATPNFDGLKKAGASVPYVNNTFVTLTFPSHYTIVTGMYEESHGIVANAMYDPKLNATFNMGSLATEWWDEAEPIWINARKSGLKVGVYFWPGSEAEVEGLRPNEWRDYDGKVPFETRVDILVDQWLTKDDFDLGLIYFDEPDHSGHRYGPEAPEMIPVIQRMDTVLGYFFKKLEDKNLQDKVDFIVTSDHGMTTIDTVQKAIILSDYVNSSLLAEVIGGGAIAHLIPTAGKAKELAAALSGIAHLSAYLKEDIPDHYHYQHNRRIMPVVAVADLGWVVMETRHSYRNKGTHGYSNDYMDMKPILMARGPSFKRDVEIDPIKSVDIYPLLCHLLNIVPAPNNGSLERARPLLLPGGPRPFNAATSSYMPVGLPYYLGVAVLSSLIVGRFSGMK